MLFPINAVLLNFLKQPWKKDITVSRKILNSTTFFNIDDDNKMFPELNQHIRMISEESCDWSLK